MGISGSDCTSSSSCANISGATGSTYVLQSADAGDTVDVVVTATNAAGHAAATSAQTGAVVAAPVDSAVPVITGTAAVGDTLSSSTGTWSNSPTSFGYQWQRCTSSSSCANISGATGATYVLQSADAGDTVDVVVTATNAAGHAAATSAQTGAVVAAPVDSAVPVITGTAAVGDTLSSSTGTWSNSPTSFGYQWQRCTSSSSCANISGATGATYVLQSADAGDTVDVVVTATNAAGHAAATSAQTGAVVAAPVDSAVPVITGTAAVGDTLSSSTGTWSNSPTSFGYQWQRCTSSSSCANISGATGATYVLQSADAGDTVDVVVTATNAAGHACGDVGADRLRWRRRRWIRRCR